MSNGINVQVEGFEELKRLIMAEANDKTKKREMLMILRQVAKPTLNAARITAPISKKQHVARGKIISPGNLKKALGLITGKGPEPTIYVGARAKGSQNGWYAHFVHEGVNIYNKGFKRKRKKGANMAAARKRTKANPFLKNAYLQTQSTVTADSEKKMAKFIQRRINKIGK
jgi:hypothetical protein